MDCDIRPTSEVLSILFVVCSDNELDLAQAATSKQMLLNNKKELI